MRARINLRYTGRNQQKSEAPRFRHCEGGAATAVVLQMHRPESKEIAAVA